MGKIAMGIDTRNGVPLDDSYAFYLHKDGSGLRELLNWNESGFFYRYQYILDSNRILKVLGIFLIGLYSGRKMMYAKLEENRKLLIRVRNLGWIVGLPLSIAMVYFEGDGQRIPRSWMGLLDTVSYALSVVPLSLAYVATICLWWLGRKEESRLRLFAPMGRMALTNYISQTVFGILIFYNLGLGLGTKIGYTYVLVISIAVCLVQMVLSRLWLKHFNYGPLEWIWRQLTYGKRLKMRKG
jgi:uncharacterized protein